VLVEIKVQCLWRRALSRRWALVKNARTGLPWLTGPGKRRLVVAVGIATCLLLGSRPRLMTTVTTNTPQLGRVT
jgi:hypothetical protein